MKKYILFFACILSVDMLAQYNGKITGVEDGETVIVSLNDGKEDKVKLYGLDAPELDQQFGVAAKSFMENYIHQEVELEYKTRDKDNYMIAIVYYMSKSGEKINLNEVVVEKGYAWKNKYTDDKQLEKLEKQARKDKAGLWRNANPTPPWEWRKNH